MTWREISCAEFVNLKRSTLIDVRSPGEYMQENIPGAINVPLFSDHERAIVGTIYATQGEMVARREALKLIAPKMSETVEHIISLRKQGGPLVVHCWRGGLRSEAVSSCLSIVGIDCWRLTGGYKAWRRMVVEDLESDKYDFDVVVLDGLTGSGKTDVLKALHDLGESVIDLEKLANHRGSVFGALGLGEQPSQKNFEAALWQELESLQKNGASVVFVEAEGKKIGKLRVPDFLWQKITLGKKVIVEGSLSARRERILRDYQLENLDKAFESLNHLKERLGKAAVENIKALADAGQFAEIVETLLKNYYDPLYARGLDKAAAVLSVDGDDPPACAISLKQNFPPETRKGRHVVVD